MMLPGPTLSEQLQQAATHRVGTHFLDRHGNDTFLSYGAIAERAARIAAALIELGVCSGQRVGIVLPTGPEFFDAFFGTMFAGAIAVPLYPPVRLGKLDEYHERTAAMLQSVDATLVLTNSTIRRVLGRTMAAAPCPLGCASISELPTDRQAFVRRQPKDLALIQFSSGTTVLPKPVALTHEQIIANIHAILSVILPHFPPTEGHVHSSVSWLPLYHDMGLIGCVLSAMAHPGKLVLIPPEAFVSNPALWLQALSKYRGTISAAPNFAYALCAERIKDEQLTDVRLDSWCMALNGAEPVAPSTLNRFVQRFAPFGFRAEALSPVYGLAEVALAVSFSSPKKVFSPQSFDRDELVNNKRAVPKASGQLLVGVGQPLPGYGVRIAAADGTACQEGQIGKLWVQGPSLMQGYFNDPAATNAVLKDGWLDTGDLGFVHEQELYIFGRSKDLIIVRGKNYAPQQLEQTVDAVPGVRTGCSAAVGTIVADGEALVLFCEHDRSYSEAPEALQQAVQAAIGRVHGITPHAVHILTPGTLPRTSSGKIRRGETLRLFETHCLHAPRSVTAVRMAVEMVRSTLSMPKKTKAKKIAKTKKS